MTFCMFVGYISACVPKHLVYCATESRVRATQTVSLLPPTDELSFLAGGTPHAGPSAADATVSGGFQPTTPGGGVPRVPSGPAAAFGSVARKLPLDQSFALNRSVIGDPYDIAGSPAPFTYVRCVQLCARLCVSR